jgi:hypothetical protein
MNELESLFEAVDDELGDTSEFEKPAISEADQWQFVNEDERFGEDYVMDLAADMMIDISNDLAAAIFTAIAEGLKESSDLSSADCARITVDKVRQFARQETLEVMADLDSRGMTPVSDAAFVQDIAYLFKQCLKMLKEGLAPNAQ